MLWSNVALEVDGADVVSLRPGGFPVDGTLEHPGVLACSAADGVDVNDGHLLVQHLAAGLDQNAGLLVQGRSLQEEAVDVDSFWWRVVDVVLGELDDQVLADHAIDILYVYWREKAANHVVKL